MKAFYLIACAFFAIVCQAQNTESFSNPGEFEVHKNGLIYDEVTMQRLGTIVDSLNLKFKVCEPKTFRSLPQGLASIISFRGDFKPIKKAMQNGMPLEDVLSKFPDVILLGREHVYQYEYTDYRNRDFIKYATLPLRDRQEFEIRLPNKAANRRSDGWIFEEDEEENSITAFWLEDVVERELPKDYAHLVQYVDCMIDTTATIYVGDAARSSFADPGKNSKISEFLNMANQFPGRPEEPKLKWEDSTDYVRYDEFVKELKEWNSRRIKSLDTKMKYVANRQLLTDALAEARTGNGHAELEFYVARYLSAEEALEMKRLRKPVGMCSQDQTPRIHAVEICKLAAQTAKWDIFLRAHLDVMNDRFERVSDGSYAWGRRGTYLKELEQLNINVIDLIIGTALRASNVNENHYFGDISRVGRAVAESGQLDEFKDRILKMVADEELDTFNRLLMAYLYLNHNYYINDQYTRQTNHERLVKALASMPENIRKGFEKME